MTTNARRPGKKISYLAINTPFLITLSFKTPTWTSGSHPTVLRDQEIGLTVTLRYQVNDTDLPYTETRMTTYKTSPSYPPKTIDSNIHHVCFQVLYLLL